MKWGVTDVRVRSRRGASPAVVDLTNDPSGPPQVRVTRSPDTAGKGRRRDIDGMRAIAVTLVVLFHAGVPFLTGGFVGVDVFFVISGFLISGMLIREASDSNRISLRNFYARRFRRLLPAAAVVLLAVLVLSLLIMSPITFGETGRDVQSAALFVSNWNFAAQASDYWAAGVDKSPVLHFWSLSVEEQFYFIWPLLLLAFVCRPRRPANPIRAKRIATVLVAVVFVASFAWSVLRTADSPTWSYFGLHTRAWELAAGAAVALLATRLARTTLRASLILTWAGIAGIILSAFWFSSTTVFPGYAALLPVVSTCLVLAGGCGRRADGMQSRFLSHPITQYFGGISYSWYLWHWPLLVFAGLLFATKGATEIPGSPMGGVPVWIIVATVALSIVAADLSKRFVEDPVRRSLWLRQRPGITLAAGAAITIAVVVAASQLLAPVAIAQASPDAPDHSTKRLTRSPAVIPAGQELVLRDDPLMARDDKGDLPPGCLIDNRTIPDFSTCNIGDPNGKKSILLVGDSQAMQWSNGLGPAAKAAGIKLYAVSRPACPYVKLEPGVWDRNGCPEFQAALPERIKQLGDVDRILITRSWVYAEDKPVEDRERIWADALVPTFTALKPYLSKITIIRDVPVAPRFPMTPECVADAESLSDCDFPREVNDGYQARAEVEVSESLGTRVGHVDFTDLICPTTTCHPVDSYGTIIYRDNLHVTRRFAAGLWSVLEDRLRALV